MAERRPETSAPIVLTTGEPAGIGPDLVVQLLQQPLPGSFCVVTDPTLLLERARAIGLDLEEVEGGVAGPGGHLGVVPVLLRAPCSPGRLDTANAGHVLEILAHAVEGCLAGRYAAMVTGPVQKSLINEAGHVFTGHTEFIAERCGIEQPVMMLATDAMRVALVTCHLPLAEVAVSITQETLAAVLRIVAHDMSRWFGFNAPVLGVCGLNPHAGESGHLGTEEIEVIDPIISKLRSEGLELVGPLPADTAFTARQLADLDVVVAMYHDQGLPVIKHHGFGEVVNITLGLPIVRTSVDHGTALDLAGSGRTEVSSLRAAIRMAERMTRGI